MNRKRQLVRINETRGVGLNGVFIGSADNGNLNEMQTPEPREAFAQIKNEFEEANETHARELEANRKHAQELAEVGEAWKRAKEMHERELEEANLNHACQLAEVRQGWKTEREAHARELAEVREGWEKGKETYVRELAEVREGWKKANEAYEREINEAQSTIHQLQAQLKVVSY